MGPHGRRLAALLTLGAAVAACAPASTEPAGSTPMTTVMPSSPPPSSVYSASPSSSGASPTAAPTVPGGWSVINPTAVRSSADGNALVLTLVQQALWFRGSRGVLLYRTVTGDFRITATVRTSRTSDPSAPPATDRVQLAGVMARADTPRQNYVFVVVGSDADNQLGVETKSTTESESEFAGTPWPSGAADLRLCRRGDAFTLERRPVATAKPWEVVGSYRRPDLPPTLQVGPAIYSDATPDLTARFEGLVIEPLAAGQAC